MEERVYLGQWFQRDKGPPCPGGTATKSRYGGSSMKLRAYTLSGNHRAERAQWNRTGYTHESCCQRCPSCHGLHLSPDSINNWAPSLQMAKPPGGHVQISCHHRGTGFMGLRVASGDPSSGLHACTAGALPAESVQPELPSLRSLEALLCPLG